ncbi:MAG: hypothetical protein FWD47_12400 [Treponema sp.]|nr:hypothetical protein [Treponema sp.]
MQDSVILYGYGQEAPMVYSKLSNDGNYNVVCFADKDTAKHSAAVEMCDGKRFAVISLAEAMEKYPKAKFWITPAIPLRFRIIHELVNSEKIDRELILNSGSKKKYEVDESRFHFVGDYQIVSRKRTMKWYFACNDRNRQYDVLIKAAVKSALKNTTLEPVCIYDGEENQLTQWLTEHGIKIIFHRVSFYQAFENHLDKNRITTASGAFLRCDIPIINIEDDFCLYTDCDVIFLKDFDYQTLDQPEYFSCSCEADTEDFEYFNTGVMYMNLKKLRKSHKEFTDFIVSNLKSLNVYDQTAYQMFYGSKMTKLPIEYNYKPYWPKDENAVILHFHGPKPFNFELYPCIERLPDVVKNLFNIIPKNYLYYLELFKKYNPDIKYSKEFLDELSRLKD